MKTDKRIESIEYVLSCLFITHGTLGCNWIKKTLIIKLHTKKTQAGLLGAEKEEKPVREKFIEQCWGKMELSMLEVCTCFVQYSSFLFSVYNNESGTEYDEGECTYFIKNCIENEMKDKCWKLGDLWMWRRWRIYRHNGTDRLVIDWKFSRLTVA